jgi:hypothetical protein
VVSYDYTVLAGTQGALGHFKKDRLFELIERLRLPVVLFAEGGGGRPGDTDVPTGSSLTARAMPAVEFGPGSSSSAPLPSEFSELEQPENTEPTMSKMPPAWGEIRTRMGSLLFEKDEATFRQAPHRSMHALLAPPQHSRLQETRPSR